MPFVLAFAIIAIAVIAITYKTYVGYGQHKTYTKILFLLLLIVAMTAPIIGYAIHFLMPNNILAQYTKPLYFLFGFVFILFIVTFIRDVLWIIIDVIRRAPLENIKNPPYLQKINIITFIICLGICLYGFYEAEKNAPIVTYEIVSNKVKKPTKVVMLADLHIDVDVSEKYIDNLVKRVNALNPDAIVLVGDLIDNKAFNLQVQTESLKNLKAKYGIYAVLGNHEFYTGAFDWGIKFGQMKFNFLNNYGMKVGDTGVYVAGIPDINAAEMDKMPIKIDNALYFADKEDYVIMLSHTPKIAEGLTKDNVDLQLSAHTHGGQIFPFHYMVKKNNDGRLAGFYDVNGIKMYVSRGTRYWGPPLRLLAPSEITVFEFKPEETDGKSDQESL